MASSNRPPSPPAGGTAPNIAEAAVPGDAIDQKAKEGLDKIKKAKEITDKISGITAKLAVEGYKSLVENFLKYTHILRPYLFDLLTNETVQPLFIQQISMYLNNKKFSRHEEALKPLLKYFDVFQKFINEMLPDLKIKNVEAVQSAKRTAIAEARFYLEVIPWSLAPEKDGVDELLLACYIDPSKGVMQTTTHHISRNWLNEHFGIEVGYAGEKLKPFSKKNVKAAVANIFLMNFSKFPLKTDNNELKEAFKKALGLKEISADILTEINKVAANYRNAILDFLNIQNTSTAQTQIKLFLTELKKFPEKLEIFMSLYTAGRSFAPLKTTLTANKVELQKLIAEKNHLEFIQRNLYRLFEIMKNAKSEEGLQLSKISSLPKNQQAAARENFMAEKNKKTKEKNQIKESLIKLGVPVDLLESKQESAIENILALFNQYLQVTSSVSLKIKNLEALKLQYEKWQKIFENIRNVITKDPTKRQDVKGGAGPSEASVTQKTAVFDAKEIITQTEQKMFEAINAGDDNAFAAQFIQLYALESDKGFLLNKMLNILISTSAAKKLNVDFIKIISTQYCTIGPSEVIEASLKKKVIELDQSSDKNIIEANNYLKKVWRLIKTKCEISDLEKNSSTISSDQIIQKKAAIEESIEILNTKPSTQLNFDAYDLQFRTELSEQIFRLNKQYDNIKQHLSVDSESKYGPLSSTRDSKHGASVSPVSALRSVSPVNPAVSPKNTSPRADTNAFAATATPLSRTVTSPRSESPRDDTKLGATSPVISAPTRSESSFVDRPPSPSTYKQYGIDKTYSYLSAWLVSQHEGKGYFAPPVIQKKITNSLLLKFAVELNSPTNVLIDILKFYKSRKPSVNMGELIETAKPELAVRLKMSASDDAKLSYKEALLSYAHALFKQEIITDRRVILKSLLWDIQEQASKINMDPSADLKQLHLLFTQTASPLLKVWLENVSELSQPATKVTSVKLFLYPLPDMKDKRETITPNKANKTRNTLGSEAYGLPRDACPSTIDWLSNQVIEVVEQQASAIESFGGIRDTDLKFDPSKKTPKRMEPVNSNDVQAWMGTGKKQGENFLFECIKRKCPPAVAQEILAYYSSPPITLEMVKTAIVTLNVPLFKFLFNKLKDQTTHLNNLLTTAEYSNNLSAIRIIIAAYFPITVADPRLESEIEKVLKSSTHDYLICVYQLIRYQRVVSLPDQEAQQICYRELIETLKQIDRKDAPELFTTFDKLPRPTRDARLKFSADHLGVSFDPSKLVTMDSKNIFQEEEENDSVYILNKEEQKLLKAAQKQDISYLEKYIRQSLTLSRNDATIADSLKNVARLLKFSTYNYSYHYLRLASFLAQYQYEQSAKPQNLLNIKKYESLIVQELFGLYKQNYPHFIDCQKLADSFLEPTRIFLRECVTARLEKEKDELGALLDKTTYPLLHHWLTQHFREVLLSHSDKTLTPIHRDDIVKWIKENRLITMFIRIQPKVPAKAIPELIMLISATNPNYKLREDFARAEENNQGDFETALDKNSAQNILERTMLLRLANAITTYQNVILPGESTLARANMERVFIEVLEKYPNNQLNILHNLIIAFSLPPADQLAMEKRIGYQMLTEDEKSRALEVKETTSVNLKDAMAVVQNADEQFKQIFESNNPSMVSSGLRIAASELLKKFQSSENDSLDFKIFNTFLIQYYRMSQQNPLPEAGMNVLAAQIIEKLNSLHMKAGANTDLLKSILNLYIGPFFVKMKPLIQKCFDLITPPEVNKITTPAAATSHASAPQGVASTGIRTHDFKYGGTLFGTSTTAATGSPSSPATVDKNKNRPSGH